MTGLMSGGKSLPWRISEKKEMNMRGMTSGYALARLACVLGSKPNKQKRLYKAFSGAQKNAPRKGRFRVYVEKLIESVTIPSAVAGWPAPTLLCRPAG